MSIQRPTPSAGILIPDVLKHLPSLHGAELKTLIVVASRGTVDVPAIAETAGLSVRAVFSSVKVLETRGIVERNSGKVTLTPTVHDQNSGVSSLVAAAPIHDHNETESVTGLITRLTGSAPTAEFIADLEQITKRTQSELVTCLSELAERNARFEAGSPLLLCAVADRFKGIGR